MRICSRSLPVERAGTPVVVKVEAVRQLGKLVRPSIA